MRILTQAFLWLLLVTVTLPASGQNPAGPSGLTAPLIQTWTYLTSETLRYNGAIADDQLVYAPLVGGKVLALRLATGEKAWEVKLSGSILANLQVSPQALYIAISTSPSEVAQTALATELRGLNRQTGATMWTRKWEQMVVSLTAAPPDKLFAGDDQGNLLALNASTGDILWQFQTGGPIRAGVSVDGEVAYAGSDDGMLYALDNVTGKDRWRFKAKEPIRSRVEVSERWLFFGSDNGFVYCLDKRSGDRRWRVRTGAAVQAKPTRVGQRLIVASYDNFVYALDPDNGNHQWRVNLAGRIAADPIVQGQAVLITTLRGRRAVVLRVEDGKKLNAFDLPSEFEIVAPPVMSGDFLVLTTDNGVVAAQAKLTS
jgi:outer membrane protein assembly factor BamB